MDQYLINARKSYDIPLDQLHELIVSGKASEQLQVHDILMIQFDGKKEPFEVTAIDGEKDSNLEPIPHSLTLQMVNLTSEERSYDEEGTADWERCTLRKYMQSDEFLYSFESGFDNYIAQVRKENGEGHADTFDRFFILSKDEIFDLYKIESERVKNNPERKSDWYWTRSCNRSDAYLRWFVNAGGYAGKAYAYGAYRFAPCFVLV